VFRFCELVEPEIWTARVCTYCELVARSDLLIRQWLLRWWHWQLRRQELRGGRSRGTSRHRRPRGRPHLIEWRSLFPSGEEHDCVAIPVTVSDSNQEDCHPSAYSVNVQERPVAITESEPLPSYSLVECEGGAFVAAGEHTRAIVGGGGKGFSFSGTQEIKRDALDDWCRVEIWWLWRR
jgi:hypothetical protein